MGLAILTLSKPSSTTLSPKIDTSSTAPRPAGEGTEQLRQDSRAGFPRRTASA
jgi:hypothetical protein